MTWLRLRQIILCALFLAGAFAEKPTFISVEAGSSFTAYVETYTETSDIRSCELQNPLGDIIHFIPTNQREDDKYEMREANYLVGCSIVVKKLDMNDNGAWELLVAMTNGRSVSQAYFVNVLTDNAQSPVETEDAPGEVIELISRPGQAIDLVVGPVNAVFCKVYDPSHHLTFEGFGRCHIHVPRVLKRHSGIWKLAVWTPGKIYPEIWQVRVLLPASEIALVSTEVEDQNGYMLLSCVALSKAKVTACHFKNPQNQEYLVTPGSVDGRYSYYEANNTIEYVSSESRFANCGLNISSPRYEDDGRWRCIIVTEEQTFYGFLTVGGDDNDTEISPRAIQKVVTVEAGERPVLGCSVPAAIRYCYFTARNGTVYTVWPGSDDYVGKGFDAGECGVLLPPARGDDAYTWQCTVGLMDRTGPEMSTDVLLEVTATPTMSARTLWSGNMNTIQIEGRAKFNAPIQYCRFVRNDGLGFTVDNAPPRYQISRKSHYQGVCMMVVSKPSSVDMYSWTVVAKIDGQLGEVSVTTRDILGTYSNSFYSTYFTLWMLIIVSTMSVFIVGMLMGPKKNREWTYRQASSVRQSFRRSVQRNATTTDYETAPPLSTKA